MYHDFGVTYLSYIAISFSIEIQDSVEAACNGCRNWLIQNFDGSYNILILILGIFIGDLLDDTESIGHRGPCPKAHGSVVTTVIESILRPWRSMKVKPYFQTGLSCPRDCLVDIRCCPLDIGVVELLECPV